MRAGNNRVSIFLKELMFHRGRLPSQLATDLGISHATVSRWLYGEDIPSTGSCQKLAEYSGVPIERILFIAGHIPGLEDKGPIEWPDYSKREKAAQRKKE